MPRKKLEPNEVAAKKARKPRTPKPPEPITQVDLTTSEGIHTTLGLIMEYFDHEEDSDGLLLIAAVGKHMYDIASQSPQPAHITPNAQGSP